MSTLKIEHGASKVRWTLLKTNIEESLANDIDLMCQWSNNDRKYVVNELLRFALDQAQEFQKYKTGRTTNPPQSKAGIETSASAPKPVANGTAKPDSSGKALAGRE